MTDVDARAYETLGLRFQDAPDEATIKKVRRIAREDVSKMSLVMPRAISRGHASDAVDDDSND
jgi:hypothetical protein